MDEEEGVGHLISEVGEKTHASGESKETSTRDDEGSDETFFEEVKSKVRHKRNVSQERERRIQGLYPQNQG